MNPTAAAAAELDRNAEGNAQNAGRYEIVPNTTKVNIVTSSAFDCGRTNHRPSARAAVNCGIAKCQRRSPERSELHQSNSIPTKPAVNGIEPIQPTRSILQPVNRWSIVGIQNQMA